jgi:hypothetical protein
VASGLGYGTAELADLSGFARPAPGGGLLRSISLAVARRPERARTLLSLRALPIVELQLSAAEHDRWLHARWPAGGERLFGGHWAQAVIPTAPEEHEYLAGHHRQAVRTNIRRANELGVTATRLAGYEEFVAASTPVYESRDGGDAVLAAMQSAPPSDRFAWYSASTPAHQAPVIVATVALFGDFGVLAVMVGNRGYQRVGHVRYLMHTFILGDLAACGIRNLLVGSVLRESSGNQYFQRLLGYRVCNVRPILTPSRGERQDIRATARRLLMTGPTVDNTQRPSRESSWETTATASSHPSPPTGEAMDDGDAPRDGAKVAAAAGSALREAAR